MAQQLQSSTVPHGFHYHYDEQPRTPERELSDPIAEPARAFRIRRRARPRVDTGISTRTSEIMAELHEPTLPSIEISEQEASVAPEVQPETIERFLTPQQALYHQSQHLAGQLGQRAVTPMGRVLDGEAFNRSSSPFSGISDSDDEDAISIGSEDGQSYGGSVTSPEGDDLADPFHYEVTSKSFNASSPSPQSSTKKPYWTKEMDGHLWQTFMSYTNDPTITPFKTLTGCAPPTGVCHRVASEARKSWKGSRTGSGTSHQVLAWPGSGSATRQRLRELCKRRTVITPHYQRMVRTPSPKVRASTPDRCPSPVRLNPRTKYYRCSRSQIRTGSPVRNSFATRDVAMSLATSISATMQPNGPLAQMTYGAYPSLRSHPYVPPTVNDLPPDTGIRLGSPFGGSNTWDSSNAQAQGQFSATNLMPPGGTSTGPRLGSPVQFASNPQSQFAPFPGRMSKRPATSALGEDEVSNGDAAARKTRHEDVSETSFMDASRRLRLRGMSLGARFAGHNQYVSEPSTVAGPATNEASQPFASLPPRGIVRSLPFEDPFHMSSQILPVPRLRSPFPGIGNRPSRGRRTASLSLPSVNASNLEPVDQRMSEDIAE